MSGVWVAVIVSLWVVVLVLAIVVAGVLRRVAVVLEARPVTELRSEMPSGPAVGSRLPNLFVAGQDGRTVALSQLPGPFVLTVLTSTCLPCLAVADWARGNHDRVARSGRKLLVLTDANGRERLALDEVLTVLTDDQDDVIPALPIPGTPFVLEVEADGAISRSSVLGGPDRLIEILEADHANHDEVIHVELAS